MSEKLFREDAAFLRGQLADAMREVEALHNTIRLIAVESDIAMIRSLCRDVMGMSGLFEQSPREQGE